MLRTKSFRLTLFSILLHFMVLAPPAALAREIRVDDDCSLHDAITTYITETSTGGCQLPSWGHPSIYLKSDITLTEPLPPITTDLTINGWGHQISGDKLHQVFVVHNHELTINKLHIVDGYSDEHGGAIYVRGGKVSLSNSTIKSSLTVEDGGAIYAIGSSVSIKDSDISGNVARNGSAVYLDEGTLNVHESAISDNVASRDGAIFVWRTETTIADSKIEGNLAQADAGGISAIDSFIEIRHSSVNANRSLKSGGGLLLARVDATIVDSSISNNLAGTDGGAIYWDRPFSDFGMLGGTLQIAESALTGNRAVDRGGAIFANIHDLFVSNSTFYDNRAGGNGGALYSEPREATFTHVTFMQNAALNGGGIYSRQPNTLSLRNSLIAGSSGGDCVGGLAGNSGNWIEDGSCEARFRGDPQLIRPAGSPLYFPLHRESRAINRADPEYCPDLDQQGTPRPQGEACDIGAFEAVDWVEGEYDYRRRGAVTSPDIIVDENCSLADAITSANRDQATGGCVAGAGDDTIRLSADTVLEETLPAINSTITIEGENHILDADGERAFTVQFGDLTLNSLTVTNAAANYMRDFDAGAIYVRYAKLQINNATFTNNWAMNGAAIYSYDSDLVISNSVFANNSAGENGAALYVYGGSASIANCIISGNEAVDGGGAIFGSGSISIQITGSVINDNRTEGEGGGIFVFGHVELTDTSLQRNVAAKGGALAGRAYSSFELDNVDFIDNIAEDCPKEYNQIKSLCR